MSHWQISANNTETTSSKPVLHFCVQERTMLTKLAIEVKPFQCHDQSTILEKEHGTRRLNNTNLLPMHEFEKSATSQTVVLLRTSRVSATLKFAWRVSLALGLRECMPHPRMLARVNDTIDNNLPSIAPQ